MARRKSEEKWERIRIDHEVNGMSFAQLEAEYEIHRSTIGRRAKKEGWNREATQDFINHAVETEREKREISQVVDALPDVQQTALRVEIDKRIAFEKENTSNMALVTQKLMQEILPEIKTAGQAKAAMETLRVEREAVLGKQPDTQINIQNNSGESAIDQLHKLRVVNEQGD